MMSDFEAKIRRSMPSLSHAERVAANYLLENLDRFLSYTSDELAINSLASKATWTRFSKTCGYGGLKGLRKAVVLSMQSTMADRNSQGDSWLYEIKNQCDTSSIAAKIAESSIKSIVETVSLVNEDQFQGAANIIINARSIRIFGMGASDIVARDLAQKLIRIGKSTIRVSDLHENILSASSMNLDDVGIFISYSGKTTEIIKLMEIVKKSGAQIIVITKHGFNYMTDLSDYQLMVSAFEDEKRVAAMSSRIAQLVVVDILYNYILKFDTNANQVNLKRSYENSRGFKEIK